MNSDDQTETPISPLLVPQWIVDRMVEEALLARPMECCGLLSGRDNRVRNIYPLRNEAASETEYLAAAGLFEPFRAMRCAEEELLGIYHSHPGTDAVPSQTDLARNYYPGTAHFIVSLAAEVPVIRAFLLTAECYEEIDWHAVAERTDGMP